MFGIDYYRVSLSFTIFVESNVNERDELICMNEVKLLFKHCEMIRFLLSMTFVIIK